MQPISVDLQEYSVLIPFRKRENLLGKKKLGEVSC